MSNSLEGKRVAFLVAPEGAEQVELTEPVKAVKAGGRPELVSFQEGSVQAYHHLEPGGRFKVDQLVDGIPTSAYDALVLPGGVANPDILRTSPAHGSSGSSSRCGGRWRPSATRRGP